MRECPHCYKKYDDTWTLCLNCEVSLKNVDVSSKDEFDRLMDMFDKEFPAPFLPGESFYAKWNISEERLGLMAQEIFKWLKLEDHPIPVRYAPKGMKAPGVYVCQGQEGAIYISVRHKEDPFEVAAILAHECMHHYMKIHHLEEPETRKNELKTDLATICSGLGVLIINGMSHKSHWYITVIALFLGRIYINEQKRSFGYFKPDEFGQYLNRYLKHKSMDGAAVMGYIHPSARSFLPSEISKKKALAKSNIIQMLEKKHKNAFVIQLIVVIIFVAGILSVYYAGNKERKIQTAKIVSEFDSMKQEIVGLEDKLKKAPAELDRLKKEMDQYEATHDTSNYANALIAYEDFKKEMQKNFKLYQVKVKLYNYKVEDLKHRTR